MNVDAILHDLAAERVADLVPLLRRAYELGFREGMASTGQSAPVPIVTPPPSPPPSDPLAPLAASSDGGSPVKASVVAPSPLEGPGDDEDDDDEDVASDSHEPPVYPVVRASSTIGGLLRKIERVFRLEERFELIVRIENPHTGRALPRNVRLSSYQRPE